jgi:hypothetical protein
VAGGKAEAIGVGNGNIIAIVVIHRHRHHPYPGVAARVSTATVTGDTSPSAKVRKAIFLIVCGGGLARLLTRVVSDRRTTR